MHRYAKWVVVSLAAISVVVVARQGAAAETLESIVKQVDSKLYYPQTEGMRSLRADVESSWVRRQLENLPEAEKVKLTFYWTRPYKHRFVVSGAPEAMADQARQVERQLAMWGDRLVPKPLAVALLNHKTTLKEEEKTYVIDARSTDPASFAWAMQYTIDKKTMMPVKWRMSTDNWDADVDVKYRKLESGKQLPIEWNADAGGTKVGIKVTYKNVGKLTLADTLTVTFTGDDGTEQTSSLKLSNHAVNQPIPKDVFPPEKK